MRHEIKEVFISDPKNLEKVRSLLDEIAQEKNISYNYAHNMTLAVNEACCNIFKHSYCGKKNGKIILDSEANDEVWRITLTDFGKPLDEKEIKHRDLDDVKPGGLGVFLIKTLMDRVYYKRDDFSGTNSIVLEINIRDS